MTDLEVIETHRMPDGTEYRVGLRRDDDAQQPEDDGQWPILRVEYRHYDYVAEAFNKAAEPYVAKFNELFERIRELRVWERYAKIFLGASQVHEWGFNRGTDYAYIAFDAKEWREKMEMDTPEYLAKLAEEKPLAEIQAWIDGDTWGWQVQKRWNPNEELEAHEGWKDEDSCWGYYGHEWAEQAAKEALADEVSTHKVVHRYTEHEKIGPHDREINAILGFLEGLGNLGESRAGYTLAEITGSSPYNGNHLEEVSESKHQRIVFESFGIDYKKIEEERELMFQRLRESAEEATDK